MVDGIGLICFAISFETGTKDEIASWPVLLILTA
jgi:hypothetical protein